MAAERRPKFHLYRQYDLSFEKLRAAVQSDSTVRADAEAELAAVAPFAAGGPHDGRCIVSKEYADLLQRALA